MDLDDVDAPPQAPSRPSRFLPKSRLKKQPAKLEPAVAPPKEEPTAAELPAVKKEEEVPSQFLASENMDVDVDNTEATTAEDAAVEGGGDGREFPLSNASTSKIDGKAMEEDDDYVVAEYDVYFTPPSSDSQLYVMQYPLRPSWRPYELEQRCTQVRVKPTSAAVEVDLSIEVESDNYERDSPIAEKLQKQILSSPGRQPQAAAYAVGLLKGKKLYLNPIHAVVQLRPSMEYLDFSDLKKKSVNIAVKEEGSTNVALAGPSMKQNNQTDPEVVESWIPVNYHSSTSDLARTYLRKMMSEEGNPLQFSMNPYEYLNSLCPGAVSNKMKASGLSRRYLLSLPLEDRLKRLLVEGPHVQRFNAIKHIAPDDPAEDVLKIVQQYAYLVQGVWAVRSHDRCTTGTEMLVRDYALFRFTQNPVMKDSELDILGHRKSAAKTVIREIATERPYLKDWKFKESTDVVFMKLYPDIVEDQRNIWQDKWKQIQGKLSARGAGPKKPMPSVHSDEGVGRATNEACPVSSSMSKEARETLSKVLAKLFLTQKVCSIQTIRQGLRDTAVSMSMLPKAGARSSALVAAVKDVVDAPVEELQAIISEYAVNVHGLYVLKSSSEYPELNPLRNDVIELFCGREPGAKLKKSEIMDAAKVKPATSEFQKVINEYCVSKGGAWVLKSGDGISSDDWQRIFKEAKLL